MSDDNNLFKLRFWREIISAPTRNKNKVINLPINNISSLLFNPPDDKAFQQFRIKMKKFITQLNENDDINMYLINIFNQSECPICLDEFTKETLYDSIILHCNHLICITCVNKLNKNECPICRMRFV